ncbi:restriction endonuclease subunit S [Rhodococcus pyridinivorans]
MNWSMYPTYEDSGIEWLGNVPAHWTVQRLKWSVASSQNGIWGSDPDGGPDDIRCVRVADFDRPALTIQDRDVTYRKVSESERRGRLLSPGDLILEKSGGGEKNPVGFVVLYDRPEPAVTSNFLARVTLQEGMEPRYWTYLHHCLYNSRLTQPSIKQTSGIQNLDQQSYFDENVCFAPTDEQVAIADFLDRETAKIDALIGKQKQLIATLREDRTATITHAVTKGLDPDAEMMDSWVEWLGEVPSHWSVRRMSWLFGMISSGTTPDSRNPAYYDGPVNWVTTGELREGQISATARGVTHLALRDHSALKVYPSGSLIIAMYGATIGRLGILAAPACTNQACCVFSEPRGVSTRFAYYALWAAREHLIQLASGGGQPNINQDKLRSLRIAVPSMEEQSRIVAYLDERCEKIDALISKATETVDTLQEYRSALITDAVTGKIDVRGVA